MTAQPNPIRQANQPGIAVGDVSNTTPGPEFVPEGEVPTADGHGNLPFESPVTGVAVGGDLSGSLPDPTVATVNGGQTPVSEATALGGALAGTLPDPTLTPVTSAAWNAATLQNSWINAGGYVTAAYLKDPLGFVHLRGFLTGGASGSLALTLPAGYRPGGKNVFGDSSGNVSAPGSYLTVDQTGAVSLFVPSGQDACSLSGVTFLAEN